MDIRHFRYFLAVARQRNFTRAAEQLGIAPPTLSRQIQDMETSLGTRLFIRQQREVSLTEAGAALLVEAEATVRQFEFAQRNAQRAGRGETGHIELGYVASAVYSGLLQRQMHGFSQAFPGRQRERARKCHGDLAGAVADGRYDMGYIRSPMTLPDGVEAVRLHREGFVLALPQDSWLTGVEGHQLRASAERDVYPAGADQRHVARRRPRRLCAAPGAAAGRVGRGGGVGVVWGRAWLWCRRRWSGM